MCLFLRSYGQVVLVIVYIPTEDHIQNFNIIYIQMSGAKLYNCITVRERERERDSQKERERDSQREREIARERER